MEIKNKQIVKTEIKNKVEKYMKEFSFYFLFNIFLNLIFIILIIIMAVFATLDIKYELGGFIYELFAIAGLLAFLKVTFKGFSKNINTLKSIREGDYDFEIEDYEMDNAIEFIEDLPTKKEEVERMRNSLSYDKIIDVLETVNIIKCKKGFYDIDLVFKYNCEELIEENDYREKNTNKN